MKQHPILFSTPMVSAILSGQKIMTRRKVKVDPESKLISSEIFPFSFLEPSEFEKSEERKMVSYFDKSPYGAVGDLLWMREEHYRFGYWIKNGFTAKGNQKWKFVACTNEVKYSDSKPSGASISRNKQNPENPIWYKRLARFMPKSACRIWLEVTNIRVEKLNSISRLDALDEGIYERVELEDTKEEKIYYQYSFGGNRYDTAIGAFKQLWCNINGFDSWNDNPWVWVIEFKRVER